MKKREGRGGRGKGEGDGEGEGGKCGASGANLLATACVCGRGLKVSGYLRDNTGGEMGRGIGGRRISSGSISFARSELGLI